MEKETKSHCPGEPRLDFLDCNRNVRPHNYGIGLIGIVSGWLENELKAGNMRASSPRKRWTISRSKC